MVGDGRRSGGDMWAEKDSHVLKQATALESVKSSLSFLIFRICVNNKIKIELKISSFPLTLSKFRIKIELKISRFLLILSKHRIKIKLKISRFPLILSKY